MAQTPVVQMKGITKRFGHVVANSQVDLTVYQGEILSLLGENGSGKTTLMNMLSGIYFPDEGQIFVGGREVTIASPKDAFDLHIGMIHQHFKLVDVFTAVENIALGLEGKLVLDKREVAARVKEICDKYGFDVDPNQKVYSMSVSQKQTLEIVKVLYRGADILILDEPTAVLTPQETDKLFAVLRNMKADGKSVIIITHKLHEVMSVSDRVAVLRKGEYIGDVPTAETSPQELTNMMVGRQVSLNIDRPAPKDPKPRLEVRGLNITDSAGVRILKDVSFTANSGEILGIAGISGCGQKELLEAIAGLQSVDKGSSILYLDPATGAQEQIIGQNPKKIRDMGIALSFVPEDRLGMGLVGDMNIPANMMLKTYGEGHGLLVNRKAPRDLAEEVVEQLEVVTPDVFTPVRKLSGGNVQKILVGRELASHPSVLMTAYAVRGLDINTSYAIYDLLNQQKAQGCAVIYVGEDLDVLLELCDRILVLCSGEVNGILDGPSATKEQVGLLMTNLQKGGADHG
ncbi:MAG: ABC transporter ATP-binding protein [Oscillospiraceae bacterium]|nr:ABC transporter ATP-binding protein [Oscillospiraceae bacterium]